MNLWLINLQIVKTINRTQHTQTSHTLLWACDRGHRCQQSTHPLPTDIHAIAEKCIPAITPTCWCSTAVRYACCSFWRNISRRRCSPAAPSADPASQEVTARVPLSLVHMNTSCVCRPQIPDYQPPTELSDELIADKCKRTELELLQSTETDFTSSSVPRTGCWEERPRCLFPSATLPPSCSPFFLVALVQPPLPPSMSARHGVVPPPYVSCSLSSQHNSSCPGLPCTTSLSLPVLALIYTLRVSSARLSLFSLSGSVTCRCCWYFYIWLLSLFYFALFISFPKRKKKLLPLWIQTHLSFNANLIT